VVNKNKMAPQKASKKKKTKKFRGGKKLTADLKRTFTGLFLLLLLIALAGFIIHHIASRKYTVPITGDFISEKQPYDKGPEFEIFPSKKIPHHRPKVDHRPSPAKLPKVAIIIDDMGYDPVIAKNFIDLDVALTFAILPYSPFIKKIANMAQTSQIQVMLHLPMEPVEYPKINPGRGALLTSMSPDQLIDQLKENFAQIPFVRGVNNHMGSKITADSNRMNQIFSVLKQKNLFFIDSRTTAKTLCIQSAHLFQVPFAQRDVFLDNIQEAKAVRKQIYTMLYYAKRQGYAIGIGHPYPVTYKALREMLPHIRKRVVPVTASNIVRIGKQ
jgi:uncharacterized protein